MKTEMKKRRRTKSKFDSQKGKQKLRLPNKTIKIVCQLAIRRKKNRNTEILNQKSETVTVIQQQEDSHLLNDSFI